MKSISAENVARATQMVLPYSAIPNTLDALLTRERVAAALTEAGYPISPKTLSTKATRGGGPAYMKFSNRALYNWGAALEWARSLTTPAVHTTAEADAARAILQK